MVSITTSKGDGSIASIFLRGQYVGHVKYGCKNNVRKSNLCPYVTVTDDDEWELISYSHIESDETICDYCNVYSNLLEALRYVSSKGEDFLQYIIDWCTAYGDDLELSFETFWELEEGYVNSKEGDDSAYCRILDEFDWDAYAESKKVLEAPLYFFRKGVAYKSSNGARWDGDDLPFGPYSELRDENFDLYGNVIGEKTELVVKLW